ncbi:sugar phosphate nucleotidyltransferase [Gottfriedia luciferensis]|uniref:sugar phosphate nucleotidyltransferase n=1 Tax=Gottfriedia luciferensis TaxID=178774 RepID=UPI000B43726F|nr:NDP-sugar synthase [Gottfriedia luciferensis]
MKVVILAGGYGQRLLPITSNIPKPLLPIANRAAIEHLLLHLTRLGFNEFIIQLHYMSQAIIETINAMKLKNVLIDFIIEEKSLGSAGCLRLSNHYLKEPFLLVNGDILFDGDIKEAIKIHFENRSDFSMFVKQVDNCGSYGNVKVKNGQIIDFVEKPNEGNEISKLVNTGIYIMNPELLKHIPDNCYFDISNDLIPLLLKENIRLHAHHLDGYWIDYGTPRRFAKLNIDWIEEKLNLPIPAVQILPRIFLGEHVTINNNVKIVSPVIIGNDVTIEENCIIGPYVSISSNIRIDQGSVLHHQAVFQKYTLNYENKFIHNSIKKISKEMH